jgi:ATP-dependent protease ClpP protease subunit
MSTKEEETEVEECVKVIGNEILFYADVDRENALDFVEKFKKLEIDLLKKKAELVGYEPSIRIHIMSDGGDIFAGMTLMNTIETSRVKVITIAQGSCCSAATFMLLGGAERKMGRNAYVLIHQISTEMWGNFQELKHELKSTDKFMKMLKRMYLEKTQIPEKMLKKLMKKDIYLSPKDCLKYGIVHALD